MTVEYLFSRAGENFIENAFSISVNTTQYSHFLETSTNTLFGFCRMYFSYFVFRIGHSFLVLHMDTAHKFLEVKFSIYKILFVQKSAYIAFYRDSLS